VASRATRDLGLQRIGTSTRFLAVGALVVGGVLSAAVAKALPGKSTHPAAVTGTNSVTPPSGGDGGSQSAGAPALAVPAQAPQPVTAPPVVSSGGS
jgi:hypothetical protein